MQPWFFAIYLHVLYVRCRLLSVHLYWLLGQLTVAWWLLMHVLTLPICGHISTEMQMLYEPVCTRTAVNYTKVKKKLANKKLSCRFAIISSLMHARKRSPWRRTSISYLREGAYVSFMWVNFHRMVVLISSNRSVVCVCLCLDKKFRTYLNDVWWSTWPV